MTTRTTLRVLWVDRDGDQQVSVMTVDSRDEVETRLRDDHRDFVRVTRVEEL